MLGGIDIGELDTRLLIQSWTSAKNAVTNQPVKTWANLKTIWVKELGPKSKEQFEARQQVAREEVRFFARSSSVFGLLTADNSNVTADNLNITADNYLGLVKIIDETMRCIRRGEMFYINGIESSGRRGFVIITAEKRDNG
jgi:head-tail adaptor